MAIKFGLKPGIGRIEAEFELVTPAFIGGGDQSISELRPSAIKGALRFWWRALQWGRFLEAENGDQKAALRSIHEAESILFGAAPDKKDGDGQGLLIIRVVHSIETITANRFVDEFEHPKEGYQYLLGQGLYHFKALVQRPCLKPGAFTLDIRLKPGITQDQTAEIANAVLAFGLFGGLGSRARRGLGSVAIHSLRLNGQDWRIPVPCSNAKFIQCCETLLDPLAPADPPFTAFSKNCRIHVSATAAGYDRLLDLAGDELLRFRSNGRFDGKQKCRVIKTSDPDPIRIKDKHKLRFWADHDLPLNISEGTQKPDRYPERLAFGLPHNYFYGKPKWKLIETHLPAMDTQDRDWRYELSVELQNDGPLYKKHKAANRRASPLLLHVHKFPSDAGAESGESFSLVHVFMPALFLPPGERLTYHYKLQPKHRSAKSKREKPAVFNHPCTAEITPAWSHIRDYMDGYKPRWRFPK